ncbi:MAG: hypothetical protein P1U65_04965 [Minwuia sp.]|nr:hypothetical protein [Minwuia sp.]
MQRLLKRYLLWIVYVGFMVLAVAFGGRESLFSTASQYHIGKYLILLIFVGFLIYSIISTGRENFFRTVAGMGRTYWGRQVGLDLYISVFLSLALIYLHEGSLLIVLLWLLPVLMFANLAILPYILLNYGSIVDLLTR